MSRATGDLDRYAGQPDREFCKVHTAPDSFTRETRPRKEQREPTESAYRTVRRVLKAGKLAERTGKACSARTPDGSIFRKAAFLLCMVIHVERCYTDPQADTRGEGACVFAAAQVVRLCISRGKPCHIMDELGYGDTEYVPGKGESL